MRILYGVVGEGMGHAIRSRVVIDHLVRQHDVQVVVSGRAHDYLAQRVGPRLKVDRIWGLTMVYEDNTVRNFRTAFRNLGQALTGGWPKNIAAYFKLVSEFEPQVVISDFESWSYLYAANHEIPVISVDNIQAINRFQHPPEILEGHQLDFQVAKQVVKWKLPGCFRYLVSAFFTPLVRKKRTLVVPSILRPEILAAQSEDGDHLLVYQTSESFEELPEILKATGRECRIYGYRRGLTEEQVDGPLRFRPFDERTFIDDLRTARAVVSGGGYTVMSEAVYLRKPMLSVPVKRQFEQIMNGRYLEYEGYGRYTDGLTTAGIHEFLERVPEYRKNLDGYRQDGNTETFAEVDAALAEAVRGGTPPPEPGTVQEPPDPE
jgi:uncharacterized protein (TIGR00661 family)